MFIFTLNGNIYFKFPPNTTPVNKLVLEKISSRNVAHILNDDTQRRYIQSVKRLMTFAQKRYPTIPSKMVV